MGTLTSYLLETLLVLLAVAGLSVGTLWLIRRVGLVRPKGPVELVGQLPLDARRSIYLVKVGRTVLVLGVSDSGFSKLSEFEANEIAGAAEASAGVRFADVLGSLTSRKGSGGTPDAPPAPAEQERP